MDDTLKQIENFLSGNLTQKEMEAFENKMRTDEKLAAEVALFKDMMGGLRLRNNKQLKNRLNEIHEQVIDKPGRTTIRLISWKYVLAVAAACILLITSYFILCNDSPTTETIFASHYVAYEPDWTTRGTEEEAITSQVKNLYENKQYQALAPLLFADSLQEKLNNVKFTMIKGIVSLENKNYTEARQYFDVAGQNPLLQAEAQWYTALSFLKEKNIDACKNILNQFAKDSSSDYHQEAVEMMEELEGVK